ncbi:hypothetical protein P3X46_017051 [Hevea brasiliensis]|uniref:Glycosyltransferase N-terminal domain-containing protein n=1 Tax=Hevea brasiliensis TaxID=3981 RepID=A0ABQ9M115_HEVBR|nr:mogroside IE synthase [Hevea brasiliensis]KAJ9173969.1 hypothetical protein P3X46_017051 [Hevea brasiliensis]
MESHQRAAETHIIALPFPAQGHINPMLQFSKLLTSKGLKVTLVTIIDNELTKAKHGSVIVDSISDNSEENGTISTMEEYWKNFSSLIERKLSEIVEKQGKSGRPISCLVYDSIMPWALDIARRLGLAAASFFTQSCAVSAIYYHVYEGRLNIPSEQTHVSLDGMPPLQSYDLPSPACGSEYSPALISLMTSQFSNIREVDWILVNTFNKLEAEVMNWMASQCPVKLIGPLIPSRYTSKRLEDDNDYGLSLFKSNNNSLKQWLDSKEACSVVYVAFGSIASLEEKQMEELACGLEKSNYHFLWVVRESEQKKLPDTFVNETSEKGLIVTWCPQTEVLAHNSVGSFMTHCGWNSTLEALSLGVPMVAMPQWADQVTNAKYIADVWTVGVRVKVNEEGIVTKEETEMCIREVMEGENANEFRRNSEKWKTLAQEAVSEGGSSDKNVEKFAAELKCI